MLSIADAVAGIAIGVIVVLFAAQPLGTDRVSFLFSPFLLLWFLSNAGIGIYNITKVPSVFKALSPSYIGAYWRVSRRTLQVWAVASCAAECCCPCLRLAPRGSIWPSFPLAKAPSLLC